MALYAELGDEQSVLALFNRIQRVLEERPHALWYANMNETVAESLRKVGRDADAQAFEARTSSKNRISV
jgi:hypothetical protein